MPDNAEVFGEHIPDLDRSLWDLFAETVATYPDRQAVVSRWQTRTKHRWRPTPRTPEPWMTEVTYAEMSRKAETLASALRLQGSDSDMQMVALLGNSAEWALLFWACLKAGITFIPIDPRSVDHLDDFLKHIPHPTYVVVQDVGTAARVDAKMCSTLAYSILIQCSSVDRNGWVDFWNCFNGYEDSLSGSSVASPTSSPPHASSPALVIFTSGTSGSPKGCPHTIRNLVAQSHNFDPNPDPLSQDRWLIHTPMSHMVGINNAIRAWRTGGTVVFPSEFFDVQATTTSLTNDLCTVMSLTPIMITALQSRSYPLPENLALDYISVGGDYIRAGDIKNCLEKLHAKVAIGAYGMSEGAPLLSRQRNDTSHRKLSSYRVLPGVMARICHPGSRDVVPKYCDGELHVGGPSVITSYLGGADSDLFYVDEYGSWLITGDMAYMEEPDSITMYGRTKDVIKRGGRLISPAVVEDYARKYMPSIHVVGVSDPVSGQISVGVVQGTRSPGAGAKQELMKVMRSFNGQFPLDNIYCAGELGICEIPKTLNGKVKRSHLQYMVESFLQKKRPPPDHLANTGPFRLKLSNIWLEISGFCPRDNERLSCFADSITLLRFCDAVYRQCGQRLYFQDLVDYDTFSKISLLLLRRENAQSSKALSSEASSAIGVSGRLSNFQISSPEQKFGRAQLAATLLELSIAIESLFPIRHSMIRMVDGPRPQSYHLRIVFSVKHNDTTKTRSGLERALIFYPMLRTIAWRPPSKVPFHAVLHASPALFSQLIYERAVDTQEEADLARLKNFTPEHLQVMFRAEIITVKSTGQHYLSMTYNHSVVDAATLISWHRDLDHCINDSDWEPTEETRYKLFVDILARSEDSEEGQESVMVHVRRLRGISRFKKSFWPPLRAPGWMIGNDEEATTAAIRQPIRESIWNGEWKAQEHIFNFPRRSRHMCVGHLFKSSMNGTDDISPSLFAQGLIAIVNAIQTKTKHAVFSSWEGGRSWPYVPESVQMSLPPAGSINGPTAEWILKLIEVPRERTISEFFRRLRYEDEQIQKHVHAPWDRVLEELGEEGVVAESVSFRQAFVWDVSIGFGLSSKHRDSYDTLVPRGRYDWADYGLVWSAYMVNDYDMCIMISWDTAQMTVAEVDGYLDCLEGVVKVLQTGLEWRVELGRLWPGCRYDWEERIGRNDPYIN